MAEGDGYRRLPGRRNSSARRATLPTLLNLPILKCWPLDGGRFITLPCVVTKDPDTGERNVGMYRIQIYDEQTTGMHWQLQKVGARHGRRYYETGDADAGEPCSSAAIRCLPFARDRAIAGWIG